MGSSGLSVRHSAPRRDGAIMAFTVQLHRRRARICVMLRKGQAVWVAFYDESDWVEATILDVGTTEVLVREAGTQRAEWVPLSRVFDVLPPVSE
jgi:hypothetical protein